LKDKLSSYNVLISLFSFLLTLLSNLILRSYLLNSVGTDYFAVNVILTNTMNAFSLFELGVGVTAVFLLYKPVMENDQVKVASLYFYFKKIYVYISLFTAIVSIPLIFFIYNFVSDVISLLSFSFIYFLYIINVVVILNCSIGKWYLYSKQKIYAFCIIEIISKSLLFFGQLIFLLYLLEPNDKYLFFVVAIPCSSVIQFIFLKLYIKKDELLMSKIKVDVDKVAKGHVIEKIKGGFNHKVGDVFMNYSDYFIISFFISLSVVTSTSNYLFMTASIVMLITKLFEGVSAKIGHLIASDDKIGKQNVFFVTYMSSLFLAVIASVWVYQYSGVFITLWLGGEYVIDECTLLLIVIAMFLQIMRISSNMMKQAGGIIELDKHIPIIESLISFVLSITLTIMYGVNGIFIAKIATGLLLSNWIKPFYIFRYILFLDFIVYMRLYIFSMAISAIIFILFDFISQYVGVDINNWLDLILISISYVFLLLVLFSLFYYRLKRQTKV
jgi:hypothetical protein